MSGRLSWVPKLGSHLVAVLVAVGVGSIFVLLSAWAGDNNSPSSDKPVELLTERTATSETFLNADGTYSTRLYAQPVHWRKSSKDGWQKIDSSLTTSKKDG